jgi:hypothetical protein
VTGACRASSASLMPRDRPNSRIRAAKSRTFSSRYLLQETVRHVIAFPRPEQTLTIVASNDGMILFILGEGQRARKRPKWLEDLIGSVCDACVSDVKGRMSGLSYRWSKPEDNSWGTWLVQIGPSVIEIVGGKDDGDTGFDFVDVDLLALPKCLDDVECFVYDPDYGGESHLTLAGKKGKREIVIEIYFEPFEDDEPQTIFDVNAGGWRGKRMGED